MQLYWCSDFILPDAIVNDIEKLMRDFLWCQGELKRGKAKVKWDDVCLPKEEGGLSIKRLKYWNVALMASHIWRLLTLKQSLWIASAWFDDWCLLGPLCDSIPFVDIELAGYHKLNKVNDIVSNNSFNWPHDWSIKFPALSTIPTPHLSDLDDQVVWRGESNSGRGGSVACIWESIRPRAPKVRWFEVVWFSQCIPKHAFVMWLLMGERLKTQDRLKPWEVRANPILNWKECRDSIVWAAKGRSAEWVVAKLCFGAAVYHIWQERNSRLFKKHKQTEEQLFETIRSNVRLMLTATNFKNSKKVEQMKIDWQLG
ncbi:uncharacterized protein [Rutidosis leptorrhynchoides]|uniref:uncharacterized protein n=1 Tax=Rutidosis leptorrhynchoides TaxID=125765 RepID=UPI003A997E50